MFNRPGRVEWLQDICMLRSNKDEYADGLNSRTSLQMLLDRSISRLLRV